MPESVWDYPRPPRVELTTRRIRIVFDGCTILETTDAVRVLETSHPPVYYLRKNDFDGVDLVPTLQSSWCEFKGRAVYWSLRTGDRIATDAAWEYPSPAPGYELLRDRIAVYAQLMDGVFVDDEPVLPQSGTYYGGWITSDVAGPFKGGHGTAGW